MLAINYELTVTYCLTINYNYKVAALKEQLLNNTKSVILSYKKDTKEP